MATPHKVVNISGDLSPRAGEPHDGLIAALRELLQQAESGEVQCVALAAQHSDGACHSAIHGRWSGFGLLGAIEATKTDVAAAYIDE